jgi:hypothetical protein
MQVRVLDTGRVETLEHPQRCCQFVTLHAKTRWRKVTTCRTTCRFGSANWFWTSIFAQYAEAGLKKKNWTWMWEIVLQGDILSTARDVLKGRWHNLVDILFGRWLKYLISVLSACVACRERCIIPDLLGSYRWTCFIVPLQIQARYGSTACQVLRTLSQTLLGCAIHGWMMIATWRGCEGTVYT